MILLACKVCWARSSSSQRASASSTLGSCWWHWCVFVSFLWFSDFLKDVRVSGNEYLFWSLKSLFQKIHKHKHQSKLGGFSRINENYQLSLFRPVWRATFPRNVNNAKHKQLKNSTIAQGVVLNRRSSPSRIYSLFWDTKKASHLKDLPIKKCFSRLNS